MPPEGPVRAPSPQARPRPGGLRARRSVAALSIGKLSIAPPPCRQSTRSALLSEGYALGGVIGRSCSNRGFTVLLAHRGRDVLAAKESSESAREGVLADLLRREFVILHGLSHPCVVRARAFVESDSGCAMLMDLAAGCQLEPLLPRGSALAATHRRKVFEAVLEAVAYLHQQDVAHMDLQAQNVMVSAAAGGGPPPTVKVVDFGSAVRAPEGCTQDASELDGFCESILPPAAPSRGPARACDIFAAGLLAAGMAAGRLLHTRDVAPEGARLELDAFARALLPAGAAHLRRALALAPGARPGAEECLAGLPQAGDWLAVGQAEVEI